ncbi:MAG: hypothetical protein M3520_00480 [Actinomycetota bacterium]|jgi:hypothetical protein|nr:hypothetical protein [Actinomycetota bacterium]
MLNGPATPKAKNAALPGIHDTIETARADLTAAKKALAPVPAKLPANLIDPDAKRARPHLNRRGLQMVLRLLAFNAEAWLAEHFNAYLADADEYRAITRNLLYQGGTVTYTPPGDHHHPAPPRHPPRRQRPRPPARRAQRPDRSPAR